MIQKAMSLMKQAAAGIRATKRRENDKGQNNNKSL